jgi:hypothetical protein
MTFVKYSKKAGEKWNGQWKEIKQGKLSSGRSGKKVTDLIKLSLSACQKREEGAKVPYKRST